MLSPWLIIKKLAPNSFARLVLLILLMTAVFSYSGGRFIFVEAFNNQVNIFPGAYVLEGESESGWNNINGIFNQDLSNNADISLFNIENSAYIIWGEPRSKGVDSLIEDIKKEDDNSVKTDEDIDLDNPQEVKTGEDVKDLPDIEPAEKEGAAEPDAGTVLGGSALGGSPDSGLKTGEEEAGRENNEDIDKNSDSAGKEEDSASEIEESSGQAPESTLKNIENSGEKGETTSLLNLLFNKAGSIFDRLANKELFIPRFVKAQDGYDAGASGEISEEPAEDAAETPDSAIIPKEKRDFSSAIVFSDFFVPLEYSENGFGNINLRMSLAMNSELTNNGIIVEYSKGESWEKLGDINSFKELSNELNGDYFQFSLPADMSWEDVKNLQIRVEYKTKDKEEAKKLEVYLDALWLEVDYDEIITEENIEEDENSEEAEEEKFELSLLSNKENFKIGEAPNFKFRFRRKLDNVDRLKAGLLGLFYDKYKNIKITTYLKTEKGQEKMEVLDIEYLSDGEFGVKLPEMPRQFRPGKNSLEIIIEDGPEIYTATQDFIWGVLAFNPDKTIYLSQETAYLQMAALDDNGDTVCDAVLKLEIIAPDGGAAILSTDNGLIKINSECGPNNVINTPDYYAYYDIGPLGKYDIKLTARTENGEREITDTFEAREYLPFEIERVGPTRIYPKADYEMKFKIKVNEDFKGRFMEYVPDGFSVVEQKQDGAVIFGANSADSVQTRQNADKANEREIMWRVDWQAGKEYLLAYTFDSPNISPEFYLLGPAKLRGVAYHRDGDEKEIGPEFINFTEIRQWQIAADALSVIYAKNRTPVTINGAEDNLASITGFSDSDYILFGGIGNINDNNGASRIESALATANDGSGHLTETEEQEEGPGIDDRWAYFSMTQRTMASTETIYLQADDPSGAGVGDEAFVMGIDTASMGALNTDYFWDEDATGDATVGTSIAAEDNRSSITFTPDGVSRYLIIASARIDAQVAENIGEMAIWDGSKSMVNHIRDTEDTADEPILFAATTTVPAAVSTTYSVRVRGEGATSIDYLSSGLLIIRLDYYEDYSCDAKQGGGAIGVNATIMATTDMQLTNAGDIVVLYFGGFSSSNQANEVSMLARQDFTTQFQLTEGDGDDSAGRNAVWETTDVHNLLWLDNIGSVDTSSHTYDISMEASASGPVSEWALVCAWSEAEKPPPVNVTVSATGTQVSTLDISSVDNYIGGSFVLTDNIGTSSVTSITITESGTVDAQNDLENIRLYYDLDTSFPYNCESESYSAADLRFGATSTSFSAANGTAVFSGTVEISTTSSMCVYAVLDMGAGGGLDETIEIEIDNPSVDVVIVSGTVDPDTSVELADTTYIYVPHPVVIADEQYKSDIFTAITNQGWTNENEVNLSGYANDITATSGTEVDIYFNLLDESSAYDTATTVPVSPCSSGIAYNSCNNKIWTIKATSTAAWYSGDWEYRKRITINSSQVSTTTSGFPVLATTTDSNLAYTGNGGHMASSTGGDILIIDSDGIVLNYEREYYSSSTGEIALWISTDISTSENKDLYIYYGNSSITTDQATTTGVWDSNYRAVWHLNEGGTGIRYDSTVFANNDITDGYDGDEAVSGLIGGADYFDGNNDRITFPDSPGLSFTDNALTMSAWVRFPVIPSTETAIMRKNNQWQIAWQNADTIRNLVSTNGTTGWTASNDENYTFSTNTWYYWTFVYNGSNITHMINGQQVGSTHAVTGNINDGNATADLAFNVNNSEYFNGTIDEVRISNYPRSDEWIETEFNNQRDVDSFLTFYGEESSDSAYFDGVVNVITIPDRGSSTDSTLGYKWQVLACNNMGECSVWNDFNSTIPNFKIDTTPPAAPGNLILATTTHTTIKLNFSSQASDANFNYYKIFYKEGIAGVDTDDTEYSDTNMDYIDYNGAASTTITNLVPDTQYVINIWAYDMAGNKTAATEIKAITLTAPHARAKSVMFLAGDYSGNGTTGQLSDTNQTFTPFNFSLAETSVEIKNAYILFEGQFAAYQNISEDYTGYNLAFDACEEPCTANAFSGTGRILKDDNTVLSYGETESNQVRLLLDVTNEVQIASYIGDGASMEAQVGYRLETGTATTSIANTRATLIITYSYDDDNSTSLTNTVIYPLESTSGGDSGSRLSSQTDDCIKNPDASSDCPLFSYNMEIPEYSSVLSQWFQVYAVNDGNGANDININVNIEGTNIDSDTFIHEAGNGEDQANLPRIAFDAVFGFSENTDQTLEYYAGSAGAPTYYLMGGEVVETYTAQKSENIKTRTVSFPIGIITNGQSTATASNTVDVYLPENGVGSGVVDIRKAWLRIIGNNYNSGAYTLTVSSKVGNNSQSSNYAYNMNAGDSVINPSYNIIHIIPSDDYTELESANATTPKAVVINTTNSSANMGGVSAELMITYAYTDESSGYLASLNLFGGQSDENGNATTAQEVVSYSVFPELKGSETVRAAALLGSYLFSDSDFDMPGAWFTMGLNIATTSPVCNDSFYHYADSMNSFTEYYRDVIPTMDTTDEQPYTACYSNTNGSDNSAGAKMNASWIYTYQWDSPPTSLTQNSWRWYENNDAVEPAAPKAAEKTSISGINIGDSLRIRMNLGITKKDLATTTQVFKLQYGIGADCSDVSADDWTDVGGAAGFEAWRGYNNPAPADNTTLPAASILLASSTKAQSYEEFSSSASNPRGVLAGGYGEWDWVLYNNSATSSSQYCFRMVKSDSTVLDDYLADSYPMLITAASNTAPNVPVSLAQYRDDGITSIPNAGWINENDVLLTAAATDPNMSEVVKLYFELIPNLSSFKTATSEPSGACSFGTAYESCSSKIWAATSSPGDYRTTAFKATTSITTISTSTTNYKWQALACDDGGACSGWVKPGVNPNFKIDMTAPTPPGNLIFATSTPTSITLNLGASTTEDNFLEYKIFYKVGTSGVTEDDTEHIDINLTEQDYNEAAIMLVIDLSANTTYAFNIWAYDQAGNKSSAPAEAVGTTTFASAPPTGFIDNITKHRTDGSGIFDMVILVNDPDNDNTLRAKIFYEAGDTCAFSSMTNITVDENGANITATYGDPEADNSYPYQVGTSTGWIITAPGANYVFFDWLSAIDLPGVDGDYCLGLVVNDGIWNQVATHTKVLTIDNLDPTAPGPLATSSKSYNSATLAFGSASFDTNFSEYKIFYKEGTSEVTESDSEFNKTDDSNLDEANYGTAATTTITGLNPNTTYVFNIWAYDTYGNKASSSKEISVKTNARPVNISADNQYRSNGITVIGNGSWIDENSVMLSASAHDQDAGDLMSFYFELITATGTYSITASPPPFACASGTPYTSCSDKIWVATTTSSSLPADWYSEDWLYRKTVTINSSQVVSSESDFAVLATTTDNDLASYARSDGYDILFTASDGTTLLNYEREYFNSSTGGFAAWIQTDISSTTDTVLYMYYGNSGQTTDMATTTGSWGGNFKGVWHLKENVVDESSQANGHLDSSVNINHGYQYGNNEIAGWIYQGQEFDGIDDYIDVGDTGSNINTISFWIKANSANEDIIDLDGGIATISLIDGVITADGFTNPNYYIDGEATSTLLRYYKPITIYASQVVANETDFPVLATTTDPSLRHVSHGGKVNNANGYDIYFTDSSGTTTINYEREYYSSSTGEIVFWIKTDISSTVDTTIYMYYGDQSITTDQATTTGVWDSNYRAVWHLNEGGTGIRYDSTVFANNDITDGYDGDEAVSGLIGGADYFDGNNDRITFPDSPGLSFTDNALTMSAWVRFPVIPSTETAIMRKENQWQIAWQDADTIRNLVSTNGTTGWTASNDENYTFSTNTWYYWTFVYNGSNITHMINGQQVGSTHAVTGNINDGNATADLAFNVNNSEYFNGTIDEVRISNYPRSDEWIETEFNNQSSVSSFLSFSGEEVIKTGAIDTNWHHIIITSSTSIDVDNLDIGRIGTSYFDGILDEVRISSSISSSSLINTQHNNQSDVNSFISFNSNSAVTSYYESVLAITIPDNPYYSTGYKWQVMACDDDNDCSAWEDFNSTIPNFKIDTTDPSPPGQLIENSKNSNSVTLDFGAQTDEDNFWEYKIYYSTSSPVTEMDNLQSSSTDSNLGYVDYYSAANTTITGLAPETTYYFNIWAYDIMGHKASSTITSVVTGSASSTPGVIFYSKNDSAIYYNVWDGANWGGEQSSGDITASGDNIRHIRAIRSDDGGKIGILFKTWDGANQEWWGAVYRFAADDFVDSLRLGDVYANSDNNQLITGCIAPLSGGEFIVIRNNNGSSGTLVYSWSGIDGWTTESAGPNPGAVLNGCKLARRSGTDNYILMTFDDSPHVGSAYYYGGSTYANIWTNWVSHSSAEEDTDNYVGEAFFDPGNNTRGAINYSNSATNDYTVAKYFTCTNSTLNFGAAVSSPTAGTDDWDNDFVHGEFSANPAGTGIAYYAGRDTGGQLNIYKVDATSPTIAWSAVANGDNISSGNLYGETNDSQKPFAISFYKGGKALVLGNYASSPSLPFYSVVTSSGNSVSATSSVPGADSNLWTRVRLYDDPNEDELVAIYQNDDVDYSAVFWNGGDNQFYSTGSQAWTELAVAAGTSANDECSSFAYTKFNSAPLPPIGLEQYKTDASTVIANQEWTDETAVKFEISANDPDTYEIIKVYLNLTTDIDDLSTGTSENLFNACAPAATFDGCNSKIWSVATSAADDYSAMPFTATATITSLASSTIGYKWQAIACDDSGACSAWTEFNSDQPNFYVDDLSPTAPGDLTDISVNSNSVTLQFGPASLEDNFSEYIIYYKIGSSGVAESDIPWTQADDGHLDNRLYDGFTDTTVTGLSSSTQYVFNIWAYDLAGNTASATIEVSTTTSALPHIAQTSYLLENDDGGDVNSNTAEAGASTTLNNINIGERINVRIQIENNGGDTTGAKVYKLQYDTDYNGSWTDVGAATAISYSYGLSDAVGGTDIDQYKAAANTNTWKNGAWYDNAYLTGSYTLPHEQFTEFVFAIKTNYAATSTTYRFRLYNNTDNKPLDDYYNFAAINTITPDIKRYSKALAGSLPSDFSDLTYYLDPGGYSHVLADDNIRDMATSNSAFPVFMFATKHTNNTDAASSTWNGQSTVAASSRNVYLQIYRFGSTNAWVTVDTESSAGAGEDFTLAGGVNSSLSEYYGAGNWVYWRVYQASGSQVLKTDYYSADFSPPAPETEQIHYRWRYDNGAETTAAWLEAEDTGNPTVGPSLGIGSSTRLRIAVSNIGGGNAANYQYELEYATSSDGCATDPGNWVTVPVNDTIEHFEMVTSSNFDDGDPTTATTTNSEGYSFVAGDMVEDPSNSTENITLSEGDYTEIEYMIEVTTNAAIAETYCFRATDQGTVLNGYNIYPVLTLGGSTNEAPHFSTYPSDNGSASTSPTEYNTNVSFTAVAGDSEGDQYYLAICKTNAVIPGNNAPPACTGGAWCVSSAFASSTTASCEYAATSSSESLDWYAFVCDKKTGFGIAECSASSQGSGNPVNDSPFVINHPPVFTSVATISGPQNPGGTFVIFATSTDTDTASSADTLDLYVCTQDNAVAGVGCAGAGNRELCSDIGNSPPNASCNFSTSTPASAGTWTYYAFIFDNHGLAAMDNSRSDTYTVNNTKPVLGALVLNGGSDITLNMKGETDKSVSTINISVMDQNGCQSLVSAVAAIYVSDNDYDCSDDPNYCYQITTADCSRSDCASSTDMVATYTCGADFKYFASPTDNSNNNPKEPYKWMSFMRVYDGANYSDPATSTGVEVITSSALDVAEGSIDFGVWNVGDNTGINNSTSTVINIGNSPIDCNISGADMIGDPSGSIEVENIKWNLVNFNYTMEGTSLFTSDNKVEIITPKATSTLATSSDEIFWGISIPYTASSSIYHGLNYFSVVLDIDNW